MYLRQYTNRAKTYKIPKYNNPLYVTAKWYEGQDSPFSTSLGRSNLHITEDAWFEVELFSKLGHLNFDPVKDCLNLLQGEWENQIY